MFSLSCQNYDAFLHSTLMYSKTMAPGQTLNGLELDVSVPFHMVIILMAPLKKVNKSDFWGF